MYTWVLPVDASRFHPRIQVGIEGRPDAPSLDLSKMGVQFEPNTWVNVSVPLKDLHAANRSLTFIPIAGFLGTDFYVDDVRLVPKIGHGVVVDILVLILLLGSLPNARSFLLKGGGFHRAKGCRRM